MNEETKENPKAELEEKADIYTDRIGAQRLGAHIDHEVEEDESLSSGIYADFNEEDDEKEHKEDHEEDHEGDIEEEDSNEQLLEAAESGDIESVKVLVEQHGADVNYMDGIQDSPLYNAVTGYSPKFLETVKYLLEKEANPSPDSQEDTPLHRAVAGFHGVNLDIIRELLKYKANANAKNGKGQTPLHIAASKGYVEVVELLLQNGASPHFIDGLGRSAISNACEDFGEGVAYLRRFNSDGFILKTKINKPEMIKILIKYGADINQCLTNARIDEAGVVTAPPFFHNLHTALNHCLSHGEVNALQFLISLGADVNQVCIEGHTILKRLPLTPPTCDRKTFMRCIQILIENGAVCDLPFLLDKYVNSFLYCHHRDFAEIGNLWKATAKLYQIAHEPNSKETKEKKETKENEFTADYIDALLKTGASFKQQSIPRANTPLHDACLLENRQFVLNLFQYHKMRNRLDYFSELLGIQNRLSFTPLDEVCVATGNKSKMIPSILNCIQEMSDSSTLIAYLSAKIQSFNDRTLYDRLNTLPIDLNVKIFEFLGLYGLHSKMPKAETDFGKKLIHKVLVKSAKSESLQTFASRKISDASKQ